MKPTTSDPSQVRPSRNWSNRILAASLFGILFFTLSPYWVDFTHKTASGRSSFLLGGPLRFDGFLHTFLNALLFVPFGFALFTFSNRRGRTRLQSLAIATIAGLVFSYGIELIQIYMPSRDSEWDDVIANTLGSAVGMALGLMSGTRIVRWLSELEVVLERRSSVRGIVLVGFLYFAIWLGVSVPLQKVTLPSNWDPNAYLSIGSDELGVTPAWSGQVTRLQIWGRSFDRARVPTLTAESSSEIGLADGMLADYDLSQAPPIPNKFGPLPELVVGSEIVNGSHPRGSFDGSQVSWLISANAVPSLVEAVRKSHQFAVRVDCLPTGGTDAHGTLVIISPLGGTTDFAMKQQGSSLLIRLRTGLQPERSSLEWSSPDIFVPHRWRSILFTFDGGNGALYVDGKMVRDSYELSPGVGLVAQFLRVKANELVAYDALYQSLVFLPIGFLLGLAFRNTSRGDTVYRLCLYAGIILPACVLEAVLVAVSGRNVSLTQVSVSLGLTIAGTLWINLDRPAHA